MVKTRRQARRKGTRKTRGGGIMNKLRNTRNRIGAKLLNLKYKATNAYDSTFQRYGGAKTRKLRGGDMKVYAALAKTLNTLK